MSTSWVPGLLHRAERATPAFVRRLMKRLAPSLVASTHRAILSVAPADAAEATIAGSIETLATRPGPTIDPEQIATAIDEREQALGHRLTGGQRQVVEQICGSGTAVSIVA